MTIFSITSEHVRELELHRKELQTAIYNVILETIKPLASKTTETNDGIDEIYLTRHDGLFMRIRVELDYLPYNPLDEIETD